MTTQAQLRDMIVAEILAAKTLAGKDVYNFGDWPSTGENMPQVIVSDTHEDSVSEARAQPNFTTVSYFMVDARLKEATRKDAQTKIDQLKAQILQAVVVNYNILKLLQQIKSIRVVKDINSDSGMHIAQVRIEFGFEYFQAAEDYDTTYAAVPLNEVDIHVDLVNVADPTGTYDSPPFPDSVTDAPRTEGPDGRDEGFLKINTSV